MVSMERSSIKARNIHHKRLKPDMAKTIMLSKA
jgi:hypothetical protein